MEIGEEQIIKLILFEQQQEKGIILILNSVPEYSLSYAIQIFVLAKRKGNERNNWGLKTDAA